MPSSIKNKPDERLEARISPDKKLLLKHAANLVGRTLTDFLVSAAYKEATRVIKEYEQIKLSVEDSHAFMHALNNPRKPSNKLIIAAKKYKKGVISE